MFTDDWEIRGNGSGDPERMQFKPMREWTAILEANGFRATFMVEAMQQLTFRKLLHRHPELQSLADRWDRCVQAAHKTGHDVQLHIHPQWLNAEYGNRIWNLKAPWSLLDHSPDDVRRMLEEGKAYLEALLRPDDPRYACVIFRAGAWCLAPSPTNLQLLKALGFHLDLSVVGGLYENTRNLRLDYRQVDEDFLPFSPRMDDARRLSPQREEIVCVPTFSFRGDRLRFLYRDIKLGVGRLSAKLQRKKVQASFFKAATNTAEDWVDVSVPRPLRIAKKCSDRYLVGEHHVADLAHLDYSLLKRMFESARQRAQQTGQKEVPVVFTNHTKDVSSFRDIERFVRDLSKRDDVRPATGSQIAKMLCEGKFEVRTASGTSAFTGSAAHHQ